MAFSGEPAAAVFCGKGLKDVKENRSLPSLQNSSTCRDSQPMHITPICRKGNCNILTEENIPNTATLNLWGNLAQKRILCAAENLNT